MKDVAVSSHRGPQDTELVAYGMAARDGSGGGSLIREGQHHLVQHQR